MLKKRNKELKIDLQGRPPWKKHWTHTLSFMVMYENVKVIHCTIKTNGCHDSHKIVHKMVKFMTCMDIMLYDSMKVINWTVLRPLYGETFANFAKLWQRILMNKILSWHTYGKPGLTAMVKHDDHAMSWYDHGDSCSLQYDHRMVIKKNIPWWWHGRHGK